MKTKLLSSAILCLSILFNTQAFAVSAPSEPALSQPSAKVQLSEQRIEELSKLFKEGEYYEVLDSKHSKEPELTEYFSTFCGHCRAFETIIDDLLPVLPESLHFNKKHISWMGSKYGPVMTKAVVTAQQLGVEKEIIPALFEQNFDKSSPLFTDDEVRNFFISHNVSEQDFDNTYNNVITLAMVQDNDQSFLDLGLRGVPALIVNNKYLVQPKADITKEQYQELVAYLLTK